MRLAKYLGMESCVHVGSKPQQHLRPRTGTGPEQGADGAAKFTMVKVNASRRRRGENKSTGEMGRQAVQPSMFCRKSAELGSSSTGDCFVQAPIE